MYARLLERRMRRLSVLKQAHGAGITLELDEDNEMSETARRDLDRIFNAGMRGQPLSATCTVPRRMSVSM